MANPFNGEVTFESGEKKFTFVLGTYAQVILEAATEESWGTFWGRHKDWTTTDVFRLFCSGLARHHEEMGAKEMSDLMDSIGGTRVADIINEAMTRAVPESARNGRDRSRPRKAKSA